MIGITKFVGTELGKITPTAAIVSFNIAFAQNLQLWFQIFMYMTASVLAITQTVIAIRKWKKFKTGD